VNKNKQEARMQDSLVHELEGALDLAPEVAAAYLPGKLYLIEVDVEGTPRRLRARPHHRQLLRNGKVRVFFRASSLELVAKQRSAR
jgi:hypothetical protein